MTLRSKHLQALATDVANQYDVRAVFGDSTMQAWIESNATFHGIRTNF